MQLQHLLYATRTSLQHFAKETQTSCYTHLKILECFLKKQQSPQKVA